MPKWLKRIFGGHSDSGEKPKNVAPTPSENNTPSINWIEAGQNPWHVPVLDVRPLTLGMLSTSKDLACAQNAVSFGGEDGICFIAAEPESPRDFPALLRYPIDRYLADGALFLPSAMEHKWALFFHHNRLIFVRSWTRQVALLADVELRGGFAIITRIRGDFAGANGDDETDPDFIIRIADYLILTHALGIPFPAPLPPGMASNTRAAALWCMSCFGKMAEFATPHRVDAPPPSVPLRTHSLLHIAAARGDKAAVMAQLDAGVPADLPAKDGLTPLHWLIAGNATEIAETLLHGGSAVDARSIQGATPLMNAVQSDKSEWVEFLLERGADANARDGRGFTALHRAAEMGKVDLVLKQANVLRQTAA
jgi:hypothetical protein